jgi:hypothetical protein
MSTVNTNVGPEHTSNRSHVLPAPLRSLGRRLLHKWPYLNYLYGASSKKLTEGLASPSVTSYLMDGCANQILEYVTGLGLARRLSVDLQLDISWFETATPKPPRLYSMGLFKGVDAWVVHSLLGKIIREEGLSYQPAILENVPRKCSLGYWQCERYFFELRDELRDRLLPREPLPAWSTTTEQAILSTGQRSVFVHVRRTDTVANPYHVLLAMDYCREAAALIAARMPNPVFFVFSDDPGVVRSEFQAAIPYDSYGRGVTSDATTPTCT